jgi:Mn-dependent DtxR family transcriptional regulator
MTTVNTSLNSWIELQLSLGERQTTIHSTIAELGVATNKQIAKKLGWEINSVTPRVIELRKMGLVSCYCGSPHLTDYNECIGEIMDPQRKAKQWMIIPKRW